MREITFNGQAAQVAATSTVIPASEVRRKERNRPVGYWTEHPEAVERLWNESWVWFGNEIRGATPTDHLVTGDHMYLTPDTALLLMSCRCPYFRHASPSNGYIRLGGQLAAALLNIASGSDGAAIEGTVDRAMDILMGMGSALTYRELDRADRDLVLSLARELERFNRGLR